ncbi:MAG: NAD(P)-binding protein, partial [Desulfobacterales bacterium]|nr:NAD(P)-binding protein [Desulfobacterales bacterium]
AGMAGMTAAAYLSRENFDVLLLEKNDKTGGLVNTFNANGFSFDTGPRALINSGIVRPILKELGIDSKKGLPNATQLAQGFAKIESPEKRCTVIFIVTSIIVIAILPYVTSWISRVYGFRTAQIRTKWIMLTLFSLGALAFWSGSEAVLPAYIVGMVLAGSAARDEVWIHRLRTLTVGFLTPFYFLRAGTLVSLPALLAAPLIFLVLLGAKVASKIFGLYPFIGLFRKEKNERWYYTLLMSTGLTFGTISAIYGFTHGIVTQEQYSFLVAAVIASAVVPTLIAGIAFLPKHLLPQPAASGKEAVEENGSGLSEEG